MTRFAHPSGNGYVESVTKLSAIGFFVIGPLYYLKYSMWSMALIGTILISPALFFTSIIIIKEIGFDASIPILLAVVGSVNYIVYGIMWVSVIEQSYLKRGWHKLG